MESVELGYYLQRIMQPAALCSWLLLTILSLVPGPDRPHTGMSGNFEHVLAYALASFTTQAGFSTIRSSRLILAFSAASALFEICQIWIPGRSPGFDNWMASSLGALLGIGLAKALFHFLERKKDSKSPAAA